MHKVFPGVAHYLTLSSFDPAGRRIAILSEAPGRIWDIETGDELAALEGHEHYSSCNVTFSPDGTRVLSTGSDINMVRLWDSFSGDILLSFCGHEGVIEQVCFSPDGKYIASASEDHTVKLWNARTGSCIRTFTEYDSWVIRVAFSRDGKTLVSGGWDGSVWIHRLCDVCPEEYSSRGDV